MKTIVQRLIIAFLSATFGGFLSIGRVEACDQSAFPSVQLRSRVIAGTVTLNGKAIDGAVLSLHKFLGPYSVEIGHADAHVLSETITTKNGSFSLGKMPTGKYVIVMAKPSYEFTYVQLVLPKKGESDTVAIEYSGDFCASATTISATGERLTRRSFQTTLGIDSADTQRR